MKNENPKGGYERATYKSIKHDKLVNEASVKIWNNIGEIFPEVIKSGRLKKLFKWRGYKTPAQPDGGIFVWDDIPIFVLEAKYQGKKGNAHERGYKNVWVLVDKNDFKLFDYIIICQGPGANLSGITSFDENCYERQCPAENVFETGYSSLVHDEFNVIRKNKISCFCQVERYTLENLVKTFQPRLVEIIQEKINSKE